MPARKPGNTDHSPQSRDPKASEAKSRVVWPFLADRLYAVHAGKVLIRHFPSGLPFDIKIT